MKYDKIIANLILLRDFLALKKENEIHVDFIGNTSDLVHCSLGWATTMSEFNDQGLGFDTNHDEFDCVKGEIDALFGDDAHHSLFARFMCGRNDSHIVDKISSISDKELAIARLNHRIAEYTKSEVPS